MHGVQEPRDKSNGVHGWKRHGYEFFVKGHSYHCIFMQGV